MRNPLTLGEILPGQKDQKAKGKKKAKKVKGGTQTGDGADVPHAVKPDTPRTPGASNAYPGGKRLCSVEFDSPKLHCPRDAVTAKPCVGTSIQTQEAQRAVASARSDYINV